MRKEDPVKRIKQLFKEAAWWYHSIEDKESRNKAFYEGCMSGLASALLALGISKYEIDFLEREVKGRFENSEELEENER